jgi:hypothetical protein
MLSNAFGSLIASEILDGMEGVLGHSARRWYAVLLARIQDHEVYLGQVILH